MYYRPSLDSHNYGKPSCRVFPLSLTKDPKDWCGQWKKLPKEKSADLVMIDDKSSAPAKTLSEMTAVVAEAIKNKKLTIMEVANILKNNGLTNLQELATTPEKIPEVAAKIEEVLNNAN